MALVIVTVAYGATIFLFPSVSAKIDSLLWMPWFSDNIRGKKDSFDTTITNPDISLFPEKYAQTLSGARDAQEQIMIWVQGTKDSIDGIRWQAEEIQWTIEKWKEQIESIKRVYDQASGTYIEIKTLIDGTQEIVSSGSIESN